MNKTFSSLIERCFLASLTGESGGALVQYKQCDGRGEFWEDASSFALPGRVTRWDHGKPHRDRSLTHIHYSKHTQV